MSKNIHQVTQELIAAAEKQISISKSPSFTCSVEINGGSLSVEEEEQIRNELVYHFADFGELLIEIDVNLVRNFFTLQVTRRANFFDSSPTT
ncbi:hypothetical protein [Pseudoalteromonas rubra]|uniref:Uncharacterized protein n=1 Tax=Pseudoalteromonas rubra TaxID=43658 RepID=A0A0F4R2Y2_9GAMM|nr:hypothetical protein [Pseudoalteromonas rubra]KJZ13157.1 hypothetical protein TW77_02180 [Pseudoalteromonas rubra]